MTRINKYSQLAAFVMIIFLIVLPLLRQTQLYPFLNYNMYPFKMNEGENSFYYFEVNGEAGKTWERLPHGHDLFTPFTMSYLWKVIGPLAWRRASLNYGIIVPNHRHRNEIPLELQKLKEAEVAKIIDGMVHSYNDKVDKEALQGKKINKIRYIREQINKGSFHDPKTVILYETSY